MFQEFGKVLMGIGIVLTIVGVILFFGGKFGIGHLPGDIVFKKGNFTFYFPLMSSIILSVVLTLILWLFRK
ncbi:hypothetical protein BVF91_03205 [Thermoanaerobacterium sp. PSU-2]|jgi:hypothetical protein|uniref:DUF2905 domain-containing protein n=1 Tax=Thermoanaerobacterium sp. PSU-2 TaxID=1930849 RepID=UPI000A14A3DF|nr:DUF2905 domain-containing protein [Thermoanaerobacterium sp. PSU-2]ORX23918.1 hypothetical protein BVF91_03205 [Thermoanaerobacterium sp. PSU-2]HHV73519.1 DUF2905 domain-containing protein [Thermoanaerobacterium sp.]